MKTAFENPRIEVIDLMEMQCKIHRGGRSGMGMCKTTYTVETEEIENTKK